MWQSNTSYLTREQKINLLEQAKVFRAERRLRDLESIGQELTNRITNTEVEKHEREASVYRNWDLNRRTFDFIGVVDEKKVAEAIDTLSVWKRQNDQPITLQFNSPGGYISSGFKLFDYVRALAARDGLGNLVAGDADPNSKSRGIFVTTVTMGMAASMAAVLLQAGNRRVASPNSWIMIHAASTEVAGDLGKLKDDLKFLERQQEKIDNVLRERSNLPQDYLNHMVSGRRDAWIDADEALAFGLIDAKGYE